MKRLYEKSELTFALVWIGVYVVVMNLALRFCSGFDELAQKTVPRCWFRWCAFSLWQRF